MPYSQNEILAEITKNFAIISNVTVSIFDANRNCVVSGSDNIPFCEAVRKRPELHKKCHECDKIGFKGCSATKKPYLYHCHMGLVEITAPIMFGDTLIGYIIIGQFADDPDKSEIKKAVVNAAREHSFNADNILTYIDSIPCPGDAYINALSQLVEMCASYIWLKNVMHLNENDLAMEIKLYIINHLNEDLSVDVMCNKYGLSKTALYQLFKKTFGSGMVQVIRSERINLAKELLKTEKMSVNEVAMQVGIPDANYFTRTFKAVTGTTPKEYAKNINLPHDVDYWK